MGKDLGTFHVKVLLNNGEGFIHKEETGGRYTKGKYGEYPLDSSWIKPTYNNKEDMVNNIIFMFTEGNFSCDCNLADFLADSKQEERIDLKCGKTLKVRELILIKPDGSELIIFP